MFFLFLSRCRRRARSRPDRPGLGLQVCACCRSDFVVPVDWEEADDMHWWIRLRCGECGHVREVTVEDDVAQRFDRALEASMVALRVAVASIDRKAMEHELDTLIGALAYDLINASDFEPCD
jgi:hypothetical protein